MERNANRKQMKKPMKEFLEWVGTFLATLPVLLLNIGYDIAFIIAFEYEQSLNVFALVSALVLAGLAISQLIMLNRRNWYKRILGNGIVLLSIIIQVIWYINMAARSIGEGVSFLKPISILLILPWCAIAVIAVRYLLKGDKKKEMENSGLNNSKSRSKAGPYILTVLAMIALARCELQRMIFASVSELWFIALVYIIVEATWIALFITDGKCYLRFRAYLVIGLYVLTLILSAIILSVSGSTSFGDATELLVSPIIIIAISVIALVKMKNKGCEDDGKE